MALHEKIIKKMQGLRVKFIRVSTIVRIYLFPNAHAKKNATNAYDGDKANGVQKYIFLMDEIF